MSGDDTAPAEGKPPSPRLQAAHQSLTRTNERMVQMRLIGVRPADLRYGFEIAITIVDVLARSMIAAGIFTESEYEELLAASIEERVATFEKRIQARLDNKEEMPR